jgi:hypothetical protein
MPDAPTDDGNDRSSDTSKLELPSLKLPGFGRRRTRTGSTAGKDEKPRSAEVSGEPVGDVQPVVEPARPVERVEPAWPVDEPDESWLDDTALVPEADASPATVPAPAPEPEPRRRPAMPPLVGAAAALVTGALVGLTGALLTYLSLRGCEAVRGTESCGGPGVLLLVAILAAMVLLGAVVLAVLHVSEPRGTSLLAVGVLAVAVLLVPQDALFSAWTFLAVPVLGAAAYALARWVTHLHVETPPERGPAHDVR